MKTSPNFQSWIIISLPIKVLTILISKHFTVKRLFKRSGLSPAEFKTVKLASIKLVIRLFAAQLKVYHYFLCAEAFNSPPSFFILIS